MFLLDTMSLNYRSPTVLQARRRFHVCVYLYNICIYKYIYVYIYTYRYYIFSWIKSYAFQKSLSYLFHPHPKHVESPHEISRMPYHVGVLPPSVLACFAWSLKGLLRRIMLQLDICRKMRTIQPYTLDKSSYSTKIRHTSDYRYTMIHKNMSCNCNEIQ